MLAHQTNKLTKDVQKCKLLIMTSNKNHKDTVDHFVKNNYFGADKSSLIFFP